MFKNLDHDLQDGVTEEMMKHLKIVSENIVLIKNQNDIYGNQIADIKSIMSYQDATIMDGNLNINYNGQHMVSGKVNLSKYLSRKMTILKIILIMLLKNYLIIFKKFIMKISKS